MFATFVTVLACIGGIPSLLYLCLILIILIQKQTRAGKLQASFDNLKGIRRTVWNRKTKMAILITIVSWAWLITTWVS